MGLRQLMEEHYRTAVKNRDTFRIAVYRLLKAALKNAEIDRGRELTEEEILEILGREARKRREAVEEFEKSGRNDLAQQERLELHLIEEYLPSLLSEEELQNLIQQVVQEVGATGEKDFGLVMRSIMPRVKGRADGRVVQQMVRQVLTRGSPPSSRSDIME